MGFLFGSTPSVVKQTQETPTVDDKEVEDAKKKERELTRRRRGRSSTLITGPSGLPEEDKKKTILGG